MSKALPGEHYCLLHQGNHSHYATHNCTVCKLIEERDQLLVSLEECVEDTVDAINTYIANYGHQWRPTRLNALRDQESRARAAIAAVRGK